LIKAVTYLTKKNVFKKICLKIFLNH